MNKIGYILLMCLCLSARAQLYTKWPVSNTNLTGNYGEIRPNHFHAGLDFAWENILGSPIYAVKSGYISRIKISPYGYGKVIYITHYDGKVSVYAHQLRFNDSISNYVKREQIRKLSYEVELFPQLNELPVKEAELIGYVGNTGGSTGPHLHFEIRDEITEIPLNPLMIYKLTDTIKPNCTSLALFDIQDTLQPQLIKYISVKNKKDSLYCVNDSIVINQSKLGIAFSGYDQEMFNGNPNNIYSAKLFLDDTLMYHHELNYIPFDLANYVNEFSFEADKRKYQKCFLPSVYATYMYKNVKNKGRIELKDTLFHYIKLEWQDEAGNSNNLKFYIKSKELNDYKWINTKAPNFMNVKSGFTHSAKSFTLNIPPNSVYQSGFISITDNFSSKKSVNISVPNTPLRQAGMMTIRLSEKQKERAGKWILKNNNSVCLPKVSENFNSYNFKSFGNLTMMLDTIAPTIKTAVPLKRLKTQIKKAENLSFKISDNLSGIANYYVYINDQWVLAEYDAKSDLLTYFFNAETPTGELKILVSVQDRVGNVGTYKLNLTR
ncbi:MAG: M23 family metallopeptidase [Bacteroidia bacterium]|nr:M23 family metallopeptidase [Bacteroidia bacterium]